MIVDLSQRPPCSPKRRLLGVAGLPRLLEKARAALNGKLGDYRYGNESAMDQRLLAFLGLEADALLAAVERNPAPLQVADWIERHGRRRTHAETRQWTRDFLTLLAKADPDRQSYIHSVLAATGLPPSTTTTCDWLEFDDHVSFALGQRLAVIGAGNVGSALGRRWARAGHEVAFGVREPAAAKTQALLVQAGGRSRAFPPKQAAERSEIVVLATPSAAVEGVLQDLGPLTGKIIVDCTNPLAPRPGGGLQLVVGHTTSGAEQLQARVPGARVVKSFNTYGWENFADSYYESAGDGDPVMFLCGDDPDACERVAGLASDLGFDPFPAGGLERARYLEPLALLWILNGRAPDRGSHFTWSCLRR
jgi:predicted dinucleotide-binding enzyme